MKSIGKPGAGKASKSTVKAGAATNSKVAPRPAVEVTELEVSRASIAKRAFEIWLQNACRHGNDIEHWLEAEKQLKSANAS